MTHDDLATDLAAHLRGASKRITWENMQMGDSGSPRPDVYTMEPTYTRMSFEAFEVKVSTSDFRSDVTSGKWQSYLRFANSVTFAAPAGLIGKADVPSTCGLILRAPGGGWRYAKKPVRHVLTELPWKAWIKLLLDGTERSGFSRRQRHFNEYRASQALGKKFGADVAGMLSDIQGLPKRLEYLRAGHEQEVERMEKSRSERTERDMAEGTLAADRCSGDLSRLAAVLGIQPDAEVTDLASRARLVADFLSASDHQWRRNSLTGLADQMEAMAGQLRTVGTALEGRKEPEGVEL